jgi:RNA polymerase sporulation-specific sigma factor
LPINGMEDECRYSERDKKTLSPEREKELWASLAHSGDEDARDELIISYRPLVFWLAGKLRVHPSSFQDLIQEGMVALIEAVDRFEPERQLRFTTYAYYRIRGRMVNFLQRSELKAPIPVDDEYLMPEDPFNADAFETVIALTEEIDRLTAREGEIIRALLMEGQNVREIARQKNMDISHVYRLRRNAVAKLKKWLNPGQMPQKRPDGG